MKGKPVWKKDDVEQYLPWKKFRSGIEFKQINPNESEIIFQSELFRIYAKLNWSKRNLQSEFGIIPDRKFELNQSELVSIRIHNSD